jgi:pimeloyl-ACP methyl ester carboxylesterase
LLIIILCTTSLSAATVDGIPLHSSIAGSGPETIILVHGWTCDETSWESQVPVLSRNYRVITLDLPGHGQSGAPANGELSMGLFARAIEAAGSTIVGWCWQGTAWAPPLSFSTRACTRSIALHWCW